MSPKTLPCPPPLDPRGGGHCHRNLAKQILLRTNVRLNLKITAVIFNSWATRSSVGFVKAAQTGSDKTPPHPAKAYKFSSTVREMSDVSRVFWSHCPCFIWAGDPERFKTGSELKETLLLCPKTRGEFFCPCVPPVSCGAQGPFPPLGIMRAGSTNPTSPLPISNPCGLGAPRGGCTVVKPQSVGGASGRRCYEVVGESSPQKISAQRATVVNGPPSGGSGSQPKADRTLEVLVQVRTAQLAVCSPGCPHPPKARSARTAVGRRDWGEGGTHSFVSSGLRSELRQAACEPSMQV